jgi:hypothetical protein
VGSNVGIRETPVLGSDRDTIKKEKKVKETAALLVGCEDTNEDSIYSSPRKETTMGTTDVTNRSSDGVDNSSVPAQLSLAEREDKSEEEIKERAQKELGFRYYTKKEQREAAGGYLPAPNFKSREQMEQLRIIEINTWVKYGLC